MTYGLKTAYQADLVQLIQQRTEFPSRLFPETSTIKARME